MRNINLKDELIRKELERQVEDFKSQIDRLWRQQSDYFEKILFVQGNIHTLIPDVEDHYGKEVAKGIEKLLNQVFEDSNMTHPTRDYNGMTHDEFIKITLHIQQDLHNKAVEFQIKAESVIKEIKAVLD